MCIDENIIALHDPKRRPALVDVKDIVGKKFVTDITIDSMRDYFCSALKNNGIGKITDNATTWRDIQSMVNCVGKLPSNVKRELVRIGTQAMAYRGKGIDDITNMCIDVLSQLTNLSKYTEGQWQKLVLQSCELSLIVLRRLQELAISTAKTGIWVNLDEYKFLTLEIRASWHRQFPESYKSESMMGFVAEYASAKWKETKTWAMSTSEKINMHTDIIAMHKDLYERIKALKSSYGQSIAEINLKYLGSKREDVEEQRKSDFMSVVDFYRAALKTLAYGLSSVSDMTALVYHATYDNAKSRASDEGISFYWHCWDKEMQHTLHHKNSDEKKLKLVPVSLLPAYRSAMIAEGVYTVDKHCLIDHNAITIGYVSVENGEYPLKNYDEIPYLLLEQERPHIEDISNSLKGALVTVTGSKYISFHGKQLDEQWAMRIIEAGKGIISLQPERIDNKGVEREYVTAYVVSPKSDVPDFKIGILPDKGNTKENRAWTARALLGKTIKIDMAKSKIIGHGLALIVDEVLSV